jgi:hypothetical protein
MKRWRWTVVGTAVTTLAGCAAWPGGGELRITAPAAMSARRLPLEVRWTARSVPAGGFAVFVDRAPIPPGKSLRWLADRERDLACLARAGCPDAAWLHARRVQVVRTRAAAIDAVDEKGGKIAGVHHVSVVPLDERGRRDGEAGDVLEVVVKGGE